MLLTISVLCWDQKLPTIKDVFWVVESPCVGIFKKFWKLRASDGKNLFLLSCLYLSCATTYGDEWPLKMTALTQRFFCTPYQTAISNISMTFAHLFVSNPQKLTFLKCPLAANFIKPKLLGMSGNEVLAKKLAKNLNRIRFEAGWIGLDSDSPGKALAKTQPQIWSGWDFWLVFSLKPHSHSCPTIFV